MPVRTRKAPVRYVREEPDHSGGWRSRSVPRPSYRRNVPRRCSPADLGSVVPCGRVAPSWLGGIGHWAGTWFRHGPAGQHPCGGWQAMPMATTTSTSHSTGTAHPRTIPAAARPVPRRLVRRIWTRATMPSTIAAGHAQIPRSCMTNSTVLPPGEYARGLNMKPRYATDRTTAPVPQAAEAIAIGRSGAAERARPVTARAPAGRRPGTGARCRHLAAGGFRSWHDAHLGALTPTAGRSGGTR